MPKRVTSHRPAVPVKSPAGPRKPASPGKTAATGWAPPAGGADAALKAKGDQLMKDEKVQFSTNTPPRKEDVLKEVLLTPDPTDHPNTRTSILALKSGKVVLKYSPFDSPPYFTAPLK